MANRDPIDVFKSWALQMGCPVDALPSNASMDRLIKSNPGGVQKFMDRSKPRSEVQLCRDNLLVSSLSDSSELLVRQQTNQPDQWKNLKRKEKLRRQIDKLKARIEDLRSAVKDKNSSLFEKAQQVKEANRTHRSAESKSIQLEQKRAQLMEKIEIEKGFEKLLPPPVIDVATNSKNEADQWVKESVQYLRTVYDDAGDRELTKVDSDNVQREIQRNVAGFPVVMLYDAIKRYCEKNVAKLNSIDQPSSEAAPAQSAFDIAITKSRIRMYIDHHLARKKLQNDYTVRVEQYVQLYEECLEQMINEAKSGDESDVELYADSICGDYLKQYGTSISNQAMLLWKKRKLSALQQRFTEREEQLEGHEEVAKELTEIYELISKTYSSANHEVMLLGDTNQSLKALQALSIYTIKNFGQRQQSNLNVSTSLFNATLGPVMSSMKLEPAEYKNDLSVLVNVKHEQWKRLPTPMDMLRPNDAISPFYKLLTPSGTLEQLKKRWAWYKVIEVLSQPLDVNESVLQVNDMQLLSAKVNAESVEMAKIMDEIRLMYQTGNCTAAEIRKYLQFLRDTSLGSLIPDTVMINRRNFRDYEEEFLCACSMLAKSVQKD